MLHRALLVLILSLSTTLFASHQVGGYLRYECLGPDVGNLIRYEVTLEFYRDIIGANAGFATQVPLTIFDQFGIANSNNNLSLVSTVFAANNLNDPCFVSVDSLLVEQALYRGIVSLPRDESFLLVYQRCCKEVGITNLRSPSNDFGNTFTIELPAFDIVGCNSSPEFNQTPPVTYCPQVPISLDLSAVDANGDSLVYSLCAPLDLSRFQSLSNPEPNPAFPPPYSSIVYQAPYSALNPIPSSPAFAINSSTGIVTGNITAIGRYALGFCIEEWKNGVLISTTRRDVLFASANCTPAIVTAVQDQTLLCDGLTVSFKNNSFSADTNYTIRGYKWDFGDPTTLSDTSRSLETAYTYPDTGLYVITLIANPGLRCSDTTIDSFRVYNALEPQISSSGSFCLDNNRTTFYPSGQYEDYATFQWEFGTSASIPNSNQDTVSNVTFNGQGQFPIRLIAQQGICKDTVISTVEIFPNPSANFDYSPKTDCPPLRVNFQNLSTNLSTANYIWVFGDGDSAFIENPSHIYQQRGDYDVKLIVQTTSNCIDTVEALVNSAVQVNLANSINEIKFDFEPKTGCQPLRVTIIDSSIYQGSADYFWDFGDGTFSTEQNPTHTYVDTGLYNLSLLLITKDTCIDTLNQLNSNPIKVNLKPEAVLMVSNNSVPVKSALVTFDSRASKFDSLSYFFINGREVAQTDFLEYQFIDTGTYAISAIVENEFNCRDTASQIVNVFDVFEFIIPNIFTPNQDGINETFKVQACGVYDYEIEIYNRYGQLVFRSNNLNINWDGRIDGKAANSGVYYYIIQIRDFRNEIRNYKGSLTLLK